MEKVLQNNLKPATHFIHVWTDGIETNQQEDIRLGELAPKRLYWAHEISDFDNILNPMPSRGLTIIAIFKIRAKD